uniref:Serine/threonine-protein phosphatase CPPED1 n=1 Tax=Leptobrachium leishanense TaxID=445787 RepID=A0A8C5QZQ4_9ANUR
MSEDRKVFLKAQGRLFTAFQEDEESQWKGPFYFIQGADPQYGLMKSWEIGDCDYGGDEWEQEIRLTEEAVQAINKLSPKPKFFVLCGDLVHSMPDYPQTWFQKVASDYPFSQDLRSELLSCYQSWLCTELHTALPGAQLTSCSLTLMKIHNLHSTVRALKGNEFKVDQERDLKTVLQKTDQDIPLVFVSGNHDIGNSPTPETIKAYCSNWGDDYFSFWVGGVLFLVLNSQFFFDSSECTELKEYQDRWLADQLAVAEKRKCKHAIVFQHIPFFIQNPDEENNYFNIEKNLRQELLETFHKAGIKAVFSGHYHRNAGGKYKNLDMVVTSAIGCQLGKDKHGLRVVVVTEETIVHRYYSLDELNSKGIEKDLMDLIISK